MPSKRKSSSNSPSKPPRDTSTWPIRLEELAAFKREHGHCNVPRIYPPNRSLGSWVAKLRQRKRAGTLPAELTRSLNQLGFRWRLVHRTVRRFDWNNMVAALAKFKREHGHCNVSQEPGQRQLSGWVGGIRVQKRRGLLNRQQIEQLDALNFVWEPIKQRWEARFAALLEYRGRYGNCNVPETWPKNPELAAWVKGQRRARKQGKLEASYVERLDAIGFEWCRSGETWESRYAALAEYRKQHGHCRVSTLDPEHASLGCWVRTQRGLRRKGKLLEERIRQLDELGFEWEVPYPMPMRPSNSIRDRHVPT